MRHASRLDDRTMLQTELLRLGAIVYILTLIEENSEDKYYY